MSAIILDAKAVKMLLEMHPEVSLELARGAAAQIATALQRKSIDETITSRVSQSAVIASLVAAKVDEAIKANLTRKVGGWVASPEVLEEAKKYTREKMEGAVEIRAASLFAKIEQEIGPKLDAMIAERLKAILGALGAPAP